MSSRVPFCILFFLLLTFGLLSCKNSSSSDDSDEITGDATTYTVTYDGNTSTSGTVPVDSAKYPQGGTVTVKGNTGNLAKTGYALEGWNTAAGGSGTDRLPGASFAMGSANVTLYAKWKESLTALWACSVSSGDKTTRFYAVTADSSGNVYAVGIQEGTTTYTYGPGVTATAGRT